MTYELWLERLQESGSRLIEQDIQDGHLTLLRDDTERRCQLLISNIQVRLCEARLVNRQPSSLASCHCL
jgi:hypothetical protein